MIQKATNWLQHNLILAAAYICYLLLLLIMGKSSIEPILPTTHQILPYTTYKVFCATIFAMYAIVFITLELPMAILNKILPDHPPYIPKRLRYRNRFKKWCGPLLLTWQARMSVASNTIVGRWNNKSTNQLTKHIPDQPLYAFPSIQHESMHQPTSQHATFGHESFTIVIDNACSYCITNDLKHYTMPPEDVNIPVKGIGGVQIRATKKGTVRWSYLNDQGQVHDEYIPNTFYHKDSPYCLYSPQHVAQVANDNYPIENGTMCITYAKEMQLVWDQRRQTRTIRLDPTTNIFMLKSATTHRSFTAFSNLIEGALGDRYHMLSPHLDDWNSQSPHIVPDDDEDTVVPNVIVPEPLAREERATRETTDIRTEEAQTETHPDLPSKMFENLEPGFTGSVQQVQVEDTQIQSNTDQAQLLAWHYRLGHLPFNRIQQLAIQGDLPAKLSRCPIPKCAACLYGRATKRAWRSRAPPNAMTIPPATAPGAVVSVDQMESAVPGLIAQMKGFLTHQRYNVATIYVDHFSGLSYVYVQKGATVEETIEGKRAFERYAKSHGVIIKHYHADNGIFEARGFQNALAIDGQTITYCGVNAHHQNGRAEKKIRDLQELARTMLLHAQHRWPEAINAHLWPYAVKVANDNCNRTATRQNEGISPIEKFSQVSIAPQVRHAHTFGSPVYLLDSALQVPGKGLPKWDQRANIGIYLGISPRHSRKVALVLNLKTGHVSPQFHVVFDDFFETLRPSAGNSRPISEWQKMTGLRKTKSLKKTKSVREYEPNIPISETMRWAEDEVGTTLNEKEMRVQQEINAEPGTSDVGTHSQDTDTTENQTTQARAENTSNQENQGATTTRSGRVSRPTTRMMESVAQQIQGIVSLFVEWEVFHDDSYKIQEQMENPIAFVASSNPDVMYMDQAMREPDRPEFEKAMIKEVTTHTDNGNWIIVQKSKVPNGTKILPAVWAMRRKRRITTGEVYKWKARLNVHGGKQEFGVNYWETYAPVISWTTIRLYLILALLNKRVTRQIDFVLAYPQADIECDLYMEFPKGFEMTNGNSKTHCLLLKRNLYGQKQAGRVWNEHLHEGLLARGFIQSEVDMCLYYHKLHDVNLLIYTDDGILTGKSDADIDKVIALMSQPAGKLRPFDMTDEGNLTDYLGVKVEHLDDGSIKLSQPHLIQQVLDDLGFNERTKGKDTPAKSTERLHRDLHGEEMKERWHYRSVIGKLNFIEKSTRPDIAYAVHQCARFSNDPKASHASAVKHIGKYLLATKDQGIYLRPNDHSFDCWVDADFVGNWNKVNADIDPSTAKSRTGFIINYGGCPVTWASKLQTEVALSTTEAKYNALSTSLRDVIHLMQLVQEANAMGWNTCVGPPNVHCKVFEDNIGALEMARLPKMRPRTKHLCIRLHHFREHVRKKLITIHHIATELQIADLLTKPQPIALFIAQRQVIMQWPKQNADTTTKYEPKVTSKSANDPTMPNHLRACDIIRVPGDERQGASSCDVSMTSAVVPYSHEESTTLGTVRERTDNETTRHEVEIDKCEANKELNSPPLTNEISDLSADQIQNYRSESEMINGEAKDANDVEDAYIIVQKRKGKHKNKK